MNEEVFLNNWQTFCATCSPEQSEAAEGSPARHLISRAAAQKRSGEALSGHPRVPPGFGLPQVDTGPSSSPTVHTSCLNSTVHTPSALLFG